MPENSSAVVPAASLEAWPHELGAERVSEVHSVGSLSFKSLVSEALAREEGRSRNRGGERAWHPASRAGPAAKPYDGQRTRAAAQRTAEEWVRSRWHMQPA